MNILLDENIPVKLADFFPDVHTVKSVKEMGWSGMKNGELLQQISDSDFDILVTADKKIRFQQNVEKFDVRLFVLDAPNTKLSTLQPYVKKLERQLTSRKSIHLIQV